MEHGLRKADLLELFKYIVIPEGLLCAGGIGKDRVLVEIKKGHLLYTEHCCTLTRQCVGK